MFKLAKLILIRHGQSIWNAENRFTGWTDVELSDKGIEEAEDLDQWQNHHPFKGGEGQVDLSSTRFSFKKAKTLEKQRNAMQTIKKHWKLVGTSRN